MAPKGSKASKGGVLAKDTIVKKRPASWHEVAVEPNNDDEEPDKNQEADTDDVSQGRLSKEAKIEQPVYDEVAKTRQPGYDDADGSSTTRGQRYAWKACRHLIEDKNILARYDYLVDPTTTMRGKQKEINQIINSFTNKTGKGMDALATKSLTVTKTETKSSESKEVKQLEGMAWFSFVGAHYASNEELAQKAWNAGEIIQKGNLYYSQKHIFEKSKSEKTKTKFVSEFGDISQDKFVAILTDVADELHSEPLEFGWTKTASKTLPARVQDKPAEEADFVVMQEREEEEEVWRA